MIVLVVFKQLGTDAGGYAKRLAFLSKSFSDIGKDLKNGLGLRRGLFSVVTAKDIKSFNDFNTAIKNGTKYTEAFKIHMSNAPIAVKRQANELIKLHIAQSKLNAKLKAGKITRKEYDAAMSANKTQMKALTAQTKSLAGAQKTSTITTKAMSVALNMLGNIAIVAAISAIIAGIDKFVNRVENTKEKVEELISTSKSALDTANSNAKRVEELADKYDKLSDGVNNLGENVSLTNEEYAEYNSLVNEIADMFPTLVQGYTDEGNAILNLKGNVNELRDAYKEAQQEAYNLLIVGGKDSEGNDILKQWKNLGHTETKNGATTLDAIKQLEAIVNMSAERFRYIEKTFSSGSHDEILALSDIEKKIVSKGFIYKALGISGAVSDEDYAKARTEAKALLQTYKSEVESALSDVESLANAYLMTNDDYAKLDEQSKKAASIIVNSLDEDIVSGFNTKTDVAEYVDNIVQTILSNETARNALNSLFTLDMKNTSADEIKTNVDKYIDIIAKAIGEDPDQLKIRLGFDDATLALNTVGKEAQDTTQKVNEANNAISSMSELLAEFDDTFSNQDKIQSAFDKIQEGASLSADEVRELIKICPELAGQFEKTADGYTISGQKLINANNNIVQSAKDAIQEQIDLLQSFINNPPKINSAGDYTLWNNQVEEAKEKIEALQTVLKMFGITASDVTSDVGDKYSQMADNISKKTDLIKTAMTEMRDTGHISVNTYAELAAKGDEYVDCLEIQNGKLVLNVEKLKDLEAQEYKNAIAANSLAIAQIKAATSGHVMSEALQDEINDLEKENVIYQQMLSDIYGTKPDPKTGDDGSDDKPDSVVNFEKELAKRQHEIALGKRKEDSEYYNWLLSAAHKAYDGLTEYQSDLWKYEEEVYEWRKKNEQDLFDQRIENLEELADKSLDNNDFEGARETVTTQKTEIQNRIIEFQTSGKRDVEDEINELNDKLKELDNTLNDISSEEYEFNISVKEDKIDDLDEEYELTGDTSVFDKKIEVYNGLISDANNEINRLLGLGYTMESEEIQNLLDEIDGYADEIADIWGDQTEVIKDNVDEQIKALDRDIETTGDTKLYSDKIKVYKDGQQKILDMIEFYRKQGYAEDSQIIKDLEAQWQDYQDSINDTLKEQVNVQIEAYGDLMDEQREMLEQQQKEQDEYYDKEIKALEDKKSALEEVNEEIEKENELEEKRQSIAEAERNLYKNVRLVYSNGQWVQKAREEDLEAVEDAEEELVNTLRQQEIQAIEDQINAINEAKSAYDESIEKQITAIDESEKAFEKAMEDSIDVRKQLDYEFIASIVGVDKANEYKLNAEKITVDVKSDETDNSAIEENKNAFSGVKSISSNDVMQMMYNMFKGSGVFNKDISFDKFQNNALNLMNSSSRFTPKIADDVVNGKGAVNNLSMNNSPTITQNITVNGAGKSGEELANQIAETCESKIIQAFTAYGHEYRNTLNKLLYGNK